MKSKIVSILLVFASVLDVSGQYRSIFSEPFNIQRKTGIDIVGKTHGKFHVFLDGAKMGQLATFNKFLSMDTVYSFNRGGDSLKKVNFYAVKDSFYHVSTEKENPRSYYWNGGVSSDTAAEVLFEFNEKIRGEASDLKMIKSYDQNAVLLHYLENKADDLNFYGVLWKVDSNQYYKRSFSQLLSNRGMEVMDKAVTNDGKVYLLVKRRFVQAAVGSADRIYYELLQLDMVNGISNVIEIKEDSIYLGNMALRMDESNKQLVVAGYYSRTNYREVHGLSFYRLNTQLLDIERKHFCEMTPYQLRRLGVNNIREKDRGIEDLNLLEIVLRSDGGILIVGQVEYSSVLSYGNNNLYVTPYSTVEVVYYHKDEVVVTSVKPDGTFHWNAVIGKKQESQDRYDPFMGVAYGISPKGLFFLSNQDIDNADQLILWQINIYGEVKRNYVCRDRMRVNSFEQTNLTEWVGVCQNFSDLRIIRFDMGDASAH